MNLSRAVVSILKVIDSGYYTDVEVECVLQCILPSEHRSLVVQPNDQLDFTENMARRGNRSDGILESGRILPVQQVPPRRLGPKRHAIGGTRAQI